MLHRLRLFFALLLVGAVCARAAEPPKEEKLITTQKVHDIFEAKCLDCHGPELPRPKGKFGYVLDLQRVADNPDYVIKGKAGDSELYKMLLDDEMPGENANVPPLTPDEKEMVKKWIDIGAPGDLPESHDHAAVATNEPPKPKEPFWRHLLRWIGQSHPMTTHFPIACMFVALLAEGLAWWTRREPWMHTVRFLVIVGALGGLVATPLGWVNAYFSAYNKAPMALLWWHRWTGTGAAVWALICAGLLLVGSCAEGSPERKRFRGALLAGAVLLGIAGFLGSALIYGLDHYAWK